MNKSQLFVLIATLCITGWLALTASDVRMLVSLSGVEKVAESNAILRMTLAFVVLSLGLVLAYTARSQKEQDRAA